MDKIIVHTIVNSTLERAWDCYTKPEHIIHWNFASDDWCCPTAVSDLKVDGKFSSKMEAKDGSVGFDFGGIYTEIIDQELIKYTMTAEPSQTPEDSRKVEITFESISDLQTKVTVAFDPESQNPTELQQQGWQAILNNFKKYTESQNI